MNLRRINYCNSLVGGIPVDYCEKILILSTAKVVDALNSINENLRGIVIVVDEKNILKGTLTDGDIRRALIKGKNLEDSISEIYNSNCKFVFENYNVSDLECFFIIDKIKLIPVVDVNKKVIDIIYEENMRSIRRKSKINSAILMAGGIGARLKPLTDDIPKPMLKVGEKPLLEILIKQLRENGFKKILISVNYKADIIENYFRDGKDFGVNIEYLHEVQKMGTAGSVKLAEKHINEPFLVVNGDILTNVNFEDILKYHLDNNFDLTIGSRDYEMQVPYGVLNLDDICVTSIEEKPLVNFTVSGGIYVLSPWILNLIPNNEYYDMNELINSVLLNSGKIGDFKIKDYWMDIGHVNDYYKANEEVGKYFK